MRLNLMASSTRKNKVETLPKSTGLRETKSEVVALNCPTNNDINAIDDTDGNEI